MSFEPGIFVVGDVLQDHPPFLPPFPASPFLHNVFTTATTPPVCALVHRLGLRPRVLRPANYSRHVQIITTFLAPFSLRRRNVSVEALKIGSNVLDEAFSVRGRFPLLLSLSLTLLAVCVCVYNTQGWSISDAFMRACTARSTATLTGLDRYIGSITMYTVREHGSRFVRFVSRREFCSIISIRRG